MPIRNASTVYYIDTVSTEFFYGRMEPYLLDGYQQHVVSIREWKCEWCGQTNGISYTCCCMCGGPREPINK